MGFTPKAKDGLKSTIKSHLLNGKIIRYDFRDEKPIEVMDRTFIRNISTMRNIGLEDCVEESIYCDHDIVHEVMDELSANYSVRKIRCGGSGCCQYTTYGAFLD